MLGWALILVDLILQPVVCEACAFVDLSLVLLSVLKEPLQLCLNEKLRKDQGCLQVLGGERPVAHQVEERGHNLKDLSDICRVITSV